MKTLGVVVISTAVLTLIPVGTASGACGVGNKIWGSNPGTGGKILAFTTNVWTFKGISTTFEIAGCNESDNWFKKGRRGRASSARLRHFVNENLDHLAVDIARGHGEHLDALAHLIGLREQDRAEFRTLTQDNFTELFPRDDTAAGETLAALHRLMAENDVLSDYVER
jgi:hypothetical protein